MPLREPARDASDRATTRGSSRRAWPTLAQGHGVRGTIAPVRVVPRLTLVAGLVSSVVACGSDPPPVAEDGGVDGGSDATLDGEPDAASATWTLDLDPTPRAAVPATLLGHYDLSGALFDFAKVEGLTARMKQAGFSEWRVGVGRWEIGTQVLPTLTDGTPCPTTVLPPAALAPAGATDLSLLAARDWFVDDGAPVTLAATADDARYQLAYARKVLDQAAAFGVEPFLDVDLMPRALARNRTPRRTTSVVPDACLATFTNAVSNAAPADDKVFAAAVAGLVRRLVQGGGGEPGRKVRHVEVWNEPEFPYFWDKAHEPKGGLDAFFSMAATTLVALDDLRTRSTDPATKALLFGLGSFADAKTAVTVLTAFDATPLPDGRHLPFDFVSFHAYDNDPLVVAAKVDAVVAARAATKHYAKTELALAEWSLSLDGKGWDPRGMDAPLHAATVLALAATAGLEHAHRSIFFDYYSGIPFGLIGEDRGPKPVFHAYTLLAAVVGAPRIAVQNAADGRLGGGLGAVLATRGTDGTLRVLVVNRDNAPHPLVLTIAGVKASPKAVRVFDTAGAAPSVRPGAPTTLPARSIALFDL